MSRWVGAVVGAVMMLVGIVWTLQGAGVLLGSFMTGAKLWLAIGLILLVAGGWLLLRTFRTARR